MALKSYTDIFEVMEADLKRVAKETCDPIILDQLSGSRSADIRQLVVQNMSSKVPTLIQLAKDDEPQVSSAAAARVRFTLKEVLYS